jgi:hypothetical protein
MYTEQYLIECGWTDAAARQGFTRFMDRANRLVMRLTGMGVEDFADADWASLYEDLGADASDDDIIECLADADDIFAQMADMA